MERHTQFPDFDHLVALNRQDPNAFEALRRNLLQEAVNQALPIYRPGLERLLARIEDARNDAATPMEAALASYRMMQESLDSLLISWNQAHYKLAELQSALVIERARRG